MKKLLIYFGFLLFSVPMYAMEGTDTTKTLVKQSSATSLEMEFIKAAQEGKIDKVEEILAQNTEINIDAQEEDRFTALMWAAKKGHLDMCRKLIEKGADVKVQNKYDRTALMFAALWGRSDVCRKLIKMGADVNAQDILGWTALIYAAKKGFLDVCKKLIEKGADVSAQDINGLTALMFAAGNGHEEVVKAIIKQVLSGGNVETSENEVVDSVLVDSVLNERLEFLKPLMIEALKYAKTDKIKSLLDIESIEGSKEKRKEWWLKITT